MKRMYRFGPVSVQFQDWPHYPNWPFWSWKLDPFQTADGIPDIIVDYCPDLVLATGAAVWADVSAGRKMYLQEDGTLLWQQIEPEQEQLLLQFTVSPDWSRITLRTDSSATVGMGAFESLTFVIYYAFLQRQVLTLHGAIVEADGKCFLLCADSGVGKTTHARLWRDHKNALILNGDRAACYQERGQWFGFGTPWCGTSGEYLNRSAALQAVVILERGKENRVSALNAMSLLAHAVYPEWDRAATEMMLSLLDRLLISIPVLKLECTPDASAVEVLHQALENLPL